MHNKNCKISVFRKTKMTNNSGRGEYMIRKVYWLECYIVLSVGVENDLQNRMLNISMHACVAV